MPTYIIRKIDQDFWNRVRSAAALDQKTVRALILELLAGYVAARESREPDVVPMDTSVPESLVPIREAK